MKLSMSTKKVMHTESKTPSRTEGSCPKLPRIKTLWDFQAVKLDPIHRGPRFVEFHSTPELTYVLFKDNQSTWATTTQEKRSRFVDILQKILVNPEFVDLLVENAEHRKLLCNSLLWLRSCLIALTLGLPLPHPQPYAFPLLLTFCCHLGRLMYEERPTLNSLRAVLWALLVVLHEQPTFGEGIPPSLAEMLPYSPPVQSNPRAAR